MRTFLRFALLPILSFSLINCQNDDNRKAITSLLKDFADEPQQFTITSDTVTTITGKKGTRLTIDPNNLEMEDGSEISGDLRVELLELTTKKELLLHNAQTVSNGEWLVSGGAYHIEIFSGNQKVRLKEGKTISAEFPQITEEPMELFYGNREENGLMNWQPTGKKFQERKYRAFILKDTTILDFESTATLRVDKYKEITLIEDLGQITMSRLRNINKDQNENFRDTLYILTDTIIRYQFRDLDYNTIEYSEDETVEQRQIAIDELTRNQFSRRNLDSVINNIRKRFDPEKYRKGEFQNKQKWIAYQKDLNRSRKMYELRYQVMSINKLGWINVDRFYPQNLDRFTLTIEDTDQLDVLYVVDRTQNTVFELYLDIENQIDLPKNIAFEIVGFGFDENDSLFGTKKRVRLNDDRSIKLQKIPMQIKEINSFLVF